ncbi:MAG: KH domain-containing protein [Proteobacteria bacterium]|nr:KH domain-containing protein [Pseudomonadota bacterium]
MQLTDLVEFMAKALVDDPDSVEVSEVEAEQSSLIELRVSKADMGKVIGKRGQNVTAMRTILSGVSAKYKKRVVLDIIE